jgi:ribosomal protein S18 acetylase RimI-like enzyme
MPQTSLTAWLRKPKAMTDAPATTQAKPPAAAGPVARDDISAFTPALQQQQHTAPAPPPSSTPPPPPNFSNLRPLAPNVELTPLTPALVPALKRLNSLLPVAYPPSFYDESIADATISSITLLALWHDEPHTTSTTTAPAPEAAAEPESDPETKTTPPALVAAAIRCRLAPSPNPTLYISTLCVLPSHRHHGLAAHLLARVTAVAITQHGVGGVTAHVWEANADAREWYAKRGFREEAREEAYYRKLRPAGAVVVRRGVGVRDLVGWAGVVGETEAG